MRDQSVIPQSMISGTMCRTQKLNTHTDIYIHTHIHTEGVREREAHILCG